MCQKFSRLLKDRLDRVGVSIPIEELTKFDLLPKEKQDFVLRWDVRMLHTVEDFYGELKDSGVYTFDSYVLKTSKGLPCLVIGVSEILVMTEGGGFELYNELSCGVPIGLAWQFPCGFAAEIVRGSLYDRITVSHVVEYMIRKAADIHGFDAFASTPAYSGYYCFLQECYKYFDVDINSMDCDYVHPVIPYKFIDDTILSIGNFSIVDNEHKNVLATVSMYRDMRVMISTSLKHNTVHIHDANQYSGEEVASLILHALIRLGIDYGESLGKSEDSSKHIGFIAKKDGTLVGCTGDAMTVATFHELVGIMDSINSTNWRIAYEWQKKALLQKSSL